MSRTCDCGAIGSCACGMAAASKTPLAIPAEAWGIVRNGKLLHLAFPGKPDHVALLPNERMARVLVTEIPTHGGDDV